MYFQMAQKGQSFMPPDHVTKWTRLSTAREESPLPCIWGNKFHQFTYGRQFTLITDCKPSTTILHPRKGLPILAAARLRRWAIRQSAYSISETVISVVYQATVYLSIDQFTKSYHVTTSLYHPQANSEAERAVVTIKRMLNKCEDPYRALLAYHTTPLHIQSY